MPKPDRHFSDLPSALELRVHDHMLCVQGAGFVTRAMTDEALAPFLVGPAPQRRLLVDLRNVSGYEAACVEVAREWLAKADTLGIGRIAFVANSSVVRTATEVVARHVGAPLRTFDTAEAATRWLEEATESVPTLSASGTPTERSRPRA